MVNLKDRKRSVNLEKMPVEQVDRIGEEIGNKLREIIDRAIKDANKLLNIYGCKALMQLEIRQQESDNDNLPNN